MSVIQRPRGKAAIGTTRPESCRGALTPHPWGVPPRTRLIATSCPTLRRRACSGLGDLPVTTNPRLRRAGVAAGLVLAAALSAGCRWIGAGSHPVPVLPPGTQLDPAGQQLPDQRGGARAPPPPHRGGLLQLRVADSAHRL